MSRNDAGQVIDHIVDFVVVKTEKAPAEIDGLRKFPATNATTYGCSAEADPPYDRLKS